MNRYSAGGEVAIPPEIEETMLEIRRNWSATLAEDFNPTLLALELIEGSNPVHDPARFDYLQHRLNHAMEFITESTRTHTLTNNCHLI